MAEGQALLGVRPHGDQADPVREGRARGSLRGSSYKSLAEGPFGDLGSVL